MTVEFGSSDFSIMALPFESRHGVCVKGLNHDLPHSTLFHPGVLQECSGVPDCSARSKVSLSSRGSCHDAQWKRSSDDSIRYFALDRR